MFAARSNQENTIYEQQQAAAAKPLNQGLNKPPKTPFGKSRNNENSVLTHGKPAAKEAKADRNAFLTPANPRTRAPLGNKTTNARALQTPVPLLIPDKPKESEKPASSKPTSPRLRRSKIRVHGGASADTELVPSQQNEERDIERMPPREVPLPEDFDDIWPHDRDYLMLQGKNLTRGWWSEFAPKKDEDDDSELSDFDTKCREIEEREKREAQTKERTAGDRANPARPTIKAKAAASALGSRPTSAATRGFAAPTASAKGRQTSTAPTSNNKKPIFDRGNPRFTAAKVASNSTIGYSKGRAVSSARRPLSDLHTKPQSSAPAEKSTLDILLGLGSLDVEDDDAELGFGTTHGGLDLLLEDEPEVFQLDQPEDV